jgi:hypothetical protein
MNLGSVLRTISLNLVRIGRSSEVTLSYRGMLLSEVGAVFILQRYLTAKVNARWMEIHLRYKAANSVRTSAGQDLLAGRFSR